jgi:hypothetical protein
MKYHTKEFRPGHWWVVDESGHPIYDGAPDANDKAVVFFDSDGAVACAQEMNKQEALKEEQTQ